MLHICDKCKDKAKYIKDKKAEKLGLYVFKCKCGNEFLAPKESPLIEGGKINES